MKVESSNHNSINVATSPKLQKKRTHPGQNCWTPTLSLETLVGTYIGTYSCGLRLSKTIFDLRN